MFSSPSPSPSPPASLKRKSTSSTPPTPNKRARLVGTFEPRLIVPTGARRSWTFPKAPRFILDPVTQGAKRTLVEEGGEEITPSPSNCKVRLLENRDALFLPSQKRLATKKYQRKRTSISSPSRKSLEFVRLRRRGQFKRRLQRVDSGICMESDEDLDPNAMVDSISPLESGEDIKLFDASAFTFTGLSVEMTEATEAAETTEATAEDDMEIEDSSISTITTTAASSEGDADSDSTSTEQATSSSKDDVKELGVEGSMTVDEKEEKEGKEEEGDSGIDVEVEDAGKEMSEQKVNNQLSAGDGIVKERIQKRLGTDGLVKLGSSSTKREVVKEEEEADDEEDEPPRRSTRRRSVKPLPTTVEEEEEEEEKGREDNNTVVVKRRSSRIKAKEEEQKGEKEEDESEKETEKEEKKEEKKEKRKLMRRKPKAEELESEASEDEREDEKKLKKRVKEETKAEVEEKEPEADKMEEDTDESLNRIGEDTDMSTDEEITDFIPEAREKTQSEDPTIEEDVAMSEDDEMIEEVTGDTSEEQLQKEAKEEIDAEKASKNMEEAKDIETTDADDEEKGSNNSLQVPTIEVKRAIRPLVLTPSKKDEFEISKMLSVPRTPRTPRSPNMSRFNITMSKAPRKLEPLLSPRRRKFNKPEDLSPHWTMKRLAAKKRQQPFNPANISRHAYRDPINDEDLLTTRKCFWDDDEVEEPYVDDQYLRVEWPLKSWGSSWMAENGGALIEFCVRKLEGFNMAW